ncbi:MAG: Vms1/Ankzf1 family peptidyl-tRNA hydrolase [Thermomicrobiales bacterium]
MAADPTQSITKHTYSSPLVADLKHALAQLADLPPSLNVPYLSVALDWRIEGTKPGRQPPLELRSSERNTAPREAGGSWRPSVEVFDVESKRLIEPYGPHGQAFDSLTADAERIRNSFDTDLDPAAKGAFYTACSAKDVFESFAVGAPTRTRLQVGPVPMLYEIVRLIENNPVYAVLLADQRDATLSFIKDQTIAQDVELESSGYPRKQQQGGWSQQRYQARADERLDAFARDIAEQTQDALNNLNVDMLIVAGEEVITTALSDQFHETVKDRIIATIPLDIRTNDADLISVTLPTAAQAERKREAEAVRLLKDAIGVGNQGVAGAEGTILALQAGEVQTLVLADGFNGQGWADFAMPAYGVGAIPDEHPLGGDVSAITELPLEEILIRLALASDVEIQVVHPTMPSSEADLNANAVTTGEPLETDAARQLQELGGVGAIYRFALEPAPSERV